MLLSPQRWASGEPIDTLIEEITPVEALVNLSEQLGALADAGEHEPALPTAHKRRHCIALLLLLLDYRRLLEHQGRTLMYIPPGPQHERALDAYQHVCQHAATQMRALEALLAEPMS